MSTETATPAAVVPASTPATPANPSPKPNQPNDAELESRRRMLGMVAPPPAEKKKEEAKPADKPEEKKVETPAVGETKKEDEKPGEKAGDKPADTAKGKRQKAPAVIQDPPAVDVGDLITKTAEAVGKTMAAANAPKTPAPEKPELPKDIEAQMDAYRILEAQGGEYKDLTKRVTEFKRKGGIEEQYIKAWKRENPGKTFDPDEDEHTAFYDENGVSVATADLDDAKEAVIERRVEERLKKKLEPQMAEQRLEARVKEVEPMARQYADHAVGSAISVFGEDMLKGVAEKGFSALEEADPVAATVIKEIVPSYQPVIADTVRLFSGAVNTAKLTKTQLRVVQTAANIEQHIEAHPEFQVREYDIGGRKVALKFSTVDKYSAMSDAERAKHWCVGQDEVLAVFHDQMRRDIKAKYDGVNELVGRVTKTGGKKTGQEEKPKVEETKPKTEPETKSPSVGGSAPPPPKKVDGDGEVLPKDKFAKAMGWK